MPSGGLEEALLEVREPPDAVWVPLVSALTWIRYDHAVDIDELLATTCLYLNLSQEELQLEMQETWRGLADHGTAGQVTIRARREGEREELELGTDELRNCRWLSWSTRAGGAGTVLGASGADRASSAYTVRVSRYDDSFSEEWERLGVGAVDYVDLVVSRRGLLEVHPRPKLGTRKLRSSAAAFHQAAGWLELQFETLPVKSRRKALFLRDMQTKFDLSANRAQEVWAQGTRKYEAWAAPGRPPKTPT